MKPEQIKLGNMTLGKQNLQLDNFHWRLLSGGDIWVSFLESLFHHP
jgi:hypothetical protein